MAVKKTKKKEEEAAVTAPELTFTEDEHSSLIKFLNMSQSHAVMNNMTFKDTHEMAQLYIKVINLSKKIEGYIFEFKKTITAGRRP